MKRLVILVALLGGRSARPERHWPPAAPRSPRRSSGPRASRSVTRIDVSKPADVVVAQATVPPGASFGWHYHRAAVAAVIKSGTLTLYDGADRTCTPQRYSAGQGFTEHAGHVHLARNEGAGGSWCSSPTSASSTASTPTCRPHAPETVRSSQDRREHLSKARESFVA